MNGRVASGGRTDIEASTYEPLDGRARAAIRALQAVIVVALLTAVDDVFEARMLGAAAADPSAVSDGRLELHDVLADVSGVVGMLALVVAGVLFLRWYHRGYGNLDALGHRRDRSLRWAVASWFVPLVNLVVPKRSVDEMWEAGQARAHPAVLHAWWGSWILSIVLDRAAARVDTSTFDGFRTFHLVSFAGDVVDVATALLAICVVGLISDRQRARHHELEAVASAARPAVAAPLPVA